MEKFVMSKNAFDRKPLMQYPFDVLIDTLSCTFQKIFERHLSINSNQIWDNVVYSDDYPPVKLKQFFGTRLTLEPARISSVEGNRLAQDVKQE